MEKPLLPTLKKQLERDANAMTHRFKKGSLKKALGDALNILIRNKNRSISVQVHDWLLSTLEYVRFPQQFGILKAAHADEQLNTTWNSMADITDVLSAFISEYLQPTADAIELEQIKLAKQHQMAENDMWDATSYEFKSSQLLAVRGHTVDYIYIL